MSFEQLEATGHERDSIIHLLTLGAFIDTNKIGEGLFRLYSQLPDRPQWLEAFMDEGEWDTDKYQDSIVRLLSVSLVTSIDLMATDARFSFHPLIAEWLKLRIDGKARAEYTEEAIKVVRGYVDNGDKVEMDIRNKGETLSHIDKIVEHDQVYHSPQCGKHISHALKDATISFGSFYRRLGRYHETQDLIERAMNDDDVSPAVRNVLANMYCDQGALEKAEKLYDKVLVSLGKTPSEKDPNTKLEGTTLALIYWTQDDKLTDDGLRYEGAYKGDFHQFDPWSVSELSTYNGLGVLYMKTGRLDLAEKLFNQALEGREKAMGPDDQYTAELIDHLEALYTRTGNYERAESLLLRALKYLDKAYGEYYMATQPTGNNLGILYMQQDRLDDAEKIISVPPVISKAVLAPLTRLLYALSTIKRCCTANKVMSAKRGACLRRLYKGGKIVARVLLSLKLIRNTVSLISTRPRKTRNGKLSICFEKQQCCMSTRLGKSIRRRRTRIRGLTLPIIILE